MASKPSSDSLPDTKKLHGWGAFIGGFVGAVAGAEEHEARKDGKLSDLVLDAIRSGHVVLIANTRTLEQADVARAHIGDSVIA